MLTWGNSTEDRFGCPDADGDGWSDEGDLWPADPEQWADMDMDGYGDNYLYDVDNQNITLTKEEMRFLMTRLNGMILMETAMETTLQITLGLTLDQWSGWRISYWRNQC